ncbi:MAG: ABC transporter permease [Candidatus Lokiarchaeota archaeon]|nr:ABC transporter permease [Candidatus Lokiarchaeota archaeon]
MSEDFRSLAKRGSRIGSIILNELTSLLKDKISLFILFIIPIVVLVTIGIGKIGYFNNPMNLWIIDYDDSAKSHEFIATMAKSDSIIVTTNYDNPFTTPSQFEALAAELLPTTELNAYIILHEGFEVQILANKSTTLVVHIDAIDAVAAFISEFLIQIKLVDFQLENIVFESDVFYIPEMRPEVEFNDLLTISAPIMLGLILFGTMNLVTSQCIVGDIPLKRLMITPLYSSEILIGKTISYSLVSIFQILITLGMIKLFAVPFYGLFLDIFFACFLCSLCGITLGIFFSAISRTRLQAAQMFLLFFIVMFILVMFVRIPYILPFLPVENLMRSFSRLAYRGMRLWEIWKELAFLMGFSLFCFLGSLIYLRRKKEYV